MIPYANQPTWAKLLLKGFRVRTLLAVVTSSTLILVAGMPNGETRWWIALLGCIAVWLLCAMGERERREEQQTERRAMARYVESSLHLEDSHHQQPDREND